MCSAKTCDTLRLTAQPWPAGRLRTRGWLHYEGTTQADSLGPVVMPNLEDPQQAWLASWGAKKKIFGPHIIKVGGQDGYTDDSKELGREPAEAPEEGGPDGGAGPEEVKEERAPRRTDETVEPVFFHAMPVAFYEELIHAYSLGAVINIGVGDGALALACLRSRIPYTGFCLTQEHKERVTTRLEELLVQGALRHGDKFFESALVKALAATCQQPDTTTSVAGSPGKRKDPLDALAASSSAPMKTPAAKKPRAKKTGKKADRPRGAEGADQEFEDEYTRKDDEDPEEEIRPDESRYD